MPCHQQRAFTDRSNGRIYKLVTDRVTPRIVDLTSATDGELVERQLDSNDWYVRHARRLLQERGPNPATTAALEKILFQNPDDTRQLRALWALHSQGALSDASALRALAAESEFVRGWTVTCAAERGNPETRVLARMVELAGSDPSPSVRLRLASAAQKLPPAERWPLLTALAGHEEDAGDHNLPLMNWYAAESAVASDPLQGVALLKAARQPRLQEFIARRVLAASLADDSKSSAPVDALVSAVAELAPPARAAVLRGLVDAAKGRTRLPEPEGWPDVYQKLRADPDAAVRGQVRLLAMLFGSASALDETRATVVDTSSPEQARREAIEILVARRDAALLEPLLDLAGQQGGLRAISLRSLVNYDDPRVSSRLISGYGTFTAGEKSAALATLVARPAGIEALVAAFDAKTIPVKDLTAPLARLIGAAGRDDFNRWLTDHWGTLNPSDGERQAEITRYRKFLGEDAIVSADVKSGREIFQRTCATCHTLFGEGGHIGPELPGNFTDTDYLLQNILDPNAVVGLDYQQTFLTTKDGNTAAGVVVSEDDRTLSLKTLSGLVTLAKQDITRRELSPLSMMPPGLLNTLEEPDVRDLFLYLRQPKQP